MDIDEEQGNPKDLLTERNSKRWEIFVDGSVNGEGNGIGIMIISPKGARVVHTFRLEFASTNNGTKYEGVVHALRLEVEMKLDDIRITSDSQLVIRQIQGIYNMNEPSLQQYKGLVAELSSKIEKVNWRHICRNDNRFVDSLAFIASMIVDPTTRYIKIETLYFPSIRKEEEEADVMIVENTEEGKADEEEDWRSQLHSYLEKGKVPRNRLEAHKLKSCVTNYELREGVLYIKSFLGPSLRCLTRKEGMEILKVVHYGDVGNHSGGRSLAYRTRMQGYYWPYMHQDAKEISRRCEECQRFGIPVQLVSNNGKQFEGENIEMLLNAFKIQSGKSTPLYPQSNGHVEATNKTVADILKKKLEGNNKGWCEQVHNAVWEYRTTRREATGMFPFCLTYGVEAVLPTEVIIPTTKREALEKNLNTDLILAKIDDLEENREVALQYMENYHNRLAREYNKCAKKREFQPGELVLREIPPYQKGGDGNLEKKWDGPYIIKRIVGNGAYELMDPERKNTGRKLDHPWNRIYLKKYYP
ncbi:uncharacterized protein LOC113279600 [Papaver somniferum]|uniref:uncharacterized protein LOC113279600 n=1 Tax=Papaver somniferum TaxID=3469 RepID=UPI000E6F9A90|nr:uncharacterized protein LOC113279600 [Papaver somniferum]